MPKAKLKMPNKRIRVTLDDALFVSSERVFVDFKTPHGDLLLSIDAENFAALVGEIANSIRVNPLECRPKPKAVSAA